MGKRQIFFPPHILGDVNKCSSEKFMHLKHIKKQCVLFRFCTLKIRCHKGL